MPKTKTTDRTKEHAAMLKEALSRPGVHEFLEVYQGWAEINQNYEAYRSATSETVEFTTTDHTTFS